VDGEMTPALHSIQRYMIVGMVIVGFVTFGIGGWAATSELTGAVIGQGVIVVDSSVKKVQHPTGGVVGELRVREGDRVAVGDILLRLDETVTRANLAIVIKSPDRLYARRARLEAERDGADVFVFPDRLMARADNADVARTMAGEQ